MPEPVVPGVEDAARIAAVINARSQTLHGVTEESADGRSPKAHVDTWKRTV